MIPGAAEMLGTPEPLEPEDIFHSPETLSTPEILGTPGMLETAEMLQTYVIPGTCKFTFAQALNEGEILIILISTIYGRLDEDNIDER
jgi:hypothetical protein